LDEIYRLHGRAALALLTSLLQSIVARHCEGSDKRPMKELVIV
jgi:hypothetical protein